MQSSSSQYQCIIIGAGPGGLQAAIHLARFNRRVLLLDRGGGRTRHAKEIVNYLGLPIVSGNDLINTGISQVKMFGVSIERTRVVSVSLEKNLFAVRTGEYIYKTSFVIASTGANEIMPRTKNISRFFASDIYTCVTCDGHHTIGKKLIVLGTSANSARLALGMKEMYTNNVMFILINGELPAGYLEILSDEGIPMERGEVQEFLGKEKLTGLRLTDGREFSCDKVMLSLGVRLNDQYLVGLDLKRDAAGEKILVNAHGESSQAGLYVVGALREGHAQAVIAAGQGAVAAIDINQQILGL